MWAVVTQGHLLLAQKGVYGIQSTGSQFSYQVGGGLDISQARWIDWRAVDLTGGALLVASTGVVVRF